MEVYTMTEEEMSTLRAEEIMRPEFLRHKYRCPDCLLTFNTEKLMNEHILSKHRLKHSRCHKCDVCNSYFLGKEHLATHRAWHYAAYRCHCGYRTCVLRRARQHALQHQGDVRHQCADCGKSFSSRSTLSYHRNKQHKEKLQCDCCGKVFASKMTLKYHLKSLTQGKEDKPPEKLYIPCKGCNKVFNSKKSYRAHVTYEEELEASHKKNIMNLDPAVKKELVARKRVKQLSLLPDAPPRKRQRKSSPERSQCGLTAGTPITPPALKLLPWQISKQESLRASATVPIDTGDNVVVRHKCQSPLSGISIAESSAASEPMVDFTRGLLKTDLGNWLCASPQHSSDTVPSSVAKVDQAPKADAKKINLGSYTEKTASDLEKWLSNVESDEEVEMMDIQTEGQTYMPLQHQLLPAHIFEDIEDDLSTWLTNDDMASDQHITNLMPTDHLTFDWVQDHNIFRGKRESFTGTAGPTFPVTDDTTPLSIFLKFFDNELIDLIVKQTNKYATQQIDQHLTPHSRLKYYKNVDRGEIAKFLAILILQGLLPNLVEKYYWGENGYLTLKYFRDIMPYNRFILIKRLLHFSDSTDSHPTLPTDEKNLRKIKPVLDLLQKKFSELYLPQQEINVDESLLKWQGRLSFAQRIANKAARVGVKSYELCESETGYLWRFFVYTGKTGGQTDELADDLPDGPADGLTDGPKEGPTDGPKDGPSDGPTGGPPLPTKVTSKIVHDLVKPLYNRGHTLVMDNFYNSPLLARYLKSQKTDCFGTLRVNREFVPEAIKTVQKHELREGELVESYTADLSVVMWRDSNVVSLISTYHDGVVGGAEKYGRFKYKPQVVLDYNRAMGGVDKKDQLLSAFPIERVRNVVWYKKVFRRLLNITLMNAHIIFRTHHKQCSAREFRRLVAESLIKIARPPVIQQPITIETLKIAPIKNKKVRPILKNNHFIGSGPCKLARCVWCKKSRTSYICRQCDVSLCLEICFVQYHTAPHTQ